MVNSVTRHVSNDKSAPFQHVEHFSLFFNIDNFYSVITICELDKNVLSAAVSFLFMDAVNKKKIIDASEFVLACAAKINAEKTM